MRKSFMKDERGQNMIEMALVVPLLLMLFLGITEFGRISYSFLSITNGARAGARYAVVNSITDTNLTNYIAAKSFPGNTNSQTTLKTGTNNLDLDGDNSKPDPNIEIKYTKSDGTAGKGIGGTVQIMVAYPVQIYAPLISKFTGNPRWVSANITMRVERL